MKDPGKTGWHMRPLWDIWYLDKGKAGPLIKESIAAVPENGRRNGLYFCQAFLLLSTFTGESAKTLLSAAVGGRH